MRSNKMTSLSTSRLTGKGIASLRRRSGLSAAKLAKRIGVSVNTVYRWETSKSPIKLRARSRHALDALPGGSTGRASAQAQGQSQGQAKRGGTYSGRTISALRRQSGFSAARFARRIGVSGNTVYRWETSKSPIKLQARSRRALDALSGGSTGQSSAQSQSQAQSQPKRGSAYSGRTISALRRQSGLSAARFAKRIGVSVNTVYRWETSKSPIKLQARSRRALDALSGGSTGQSSAQTQSQSQSQAQSHPKRGSAYSGRTISALRRQSGLSAARFARRIGVSGNTVYRWETSKSPIKLQARSRRALDALSGGFTGQSSAQTQSQSQSQAQSHPKRGGAYSGRTISALRKQSGLSAAKFARRIGVSVNTVYRWETSKSPIKLRALSRRALDAMPRGSTGRPSAQTQSQSQSQAQSHPKRGGAYSGRTISALRKQSGLSAAKFARRIGVSVNTVYRWETSKSPIKLRALSRRALDAMPRGSTGRPSAQTKTQSHPKRGGAYSGRTISALRKQSGLSAAKFARRIGVSVNTVYRWETSKSPIKLRALSRRALDAMPRGSTGRPSAQTKTQSHPKRGSAYSGRTISALRKQSGLSAAKFAKRIGVSVNTVYRWETSKSPIKLRALSRRALDTMPKGSTGRPSAQTKTQSHPKRSGTYSGKTISALRRQSGLSAAKFARRIGVSVNTVYRWEASRSPIKLRARSLHALRALQ